ncbi:MAG TPA: DUF3500 domain-containing protein [Gemmataceae bacterium]|nr:DUF3500 domain-containing protein [Gemmataceae bacterium]
MKRLRSVALAAVVAATFAALALVGQPPAPTGAKMSAAAKKFLGTLSPEQKKKATFAFDDKARLAWFFTPQQDKDRKATRVGVRMEELNADQKAAALELLKTGLSKRGFEQATTIMSLEGILADLEGPKGAMVRNTGWYFVSIFGDPSDTGSWGWRMEGHHMSVNYTLDKGQVVTATPLMFGANPAEVKDGARKGLRTLPGIEDSARALIKSLTPDQDKVAKQPKAFAEIKENSPRADVGPPVGITADKLNADQRKTLTALLADYAERLPEDLATEEMKKVNTAAPEKLSFAYSGSPVPGEPYTYRVYGPGFVVEFLNVQADSAKNPANHIHSSWRRLPVDFGLAE